MNFREQFAGWAVVVSLFSIGSSATNSIAQTGQSPPAGAQSSSAALPTAPSAAGGTIHGSVKAGTIPLPGVSVTATNTLTGKKFTTTTDVNGTYSMNIPQNGRYVIRAELAAFALATKEALLNASSHEQQADFAMTLASRAAQQEEREQASTRQYGSASGAQSLALLGAAADLLQAGSGGGNSGAQLPSISGNSDFSGDSVAVTGQAGTTNPFAGMGDLREGFENQQQLQALGQTPGQTAGNGGGGGFFGGPGGGFGGPGGGGGGGGGRRGDFRNFKPSQPHGAIFWNGGFSALNAQPFAVRGNAAPNPSYSTNHYGLTIAGEPFIPKLTKPSSKDFVFLTLSGQHSTSPLNEYATVPTALEREGNFSELTGTNNALIPIYNPTTGLPYPNNIINTPLSPQSLALLQYLPAPNLQGTTQNFRLLTTSGSNTDVVGVRYNHSFGASTGNIPSFVRQFANTGTGLNQSFNINFNYSHAASDDINIFPELGGKQQTHSYSLAGGYTIGKGKLTNNITFTWNRNNSQLNNYFTNVQDVATQVGILGPDNSALNTNPLNYGLPSMVFNQYSGFNQTQANFRLTQTFVLAESSSWRRGKHNVRFGGDFHRVQLNLIGTSNATGSLTFTGFATQEPGTSNENQVATSGSSFADFLLGIPQETTIQAPQQEAYMRQNIWDLYAQDDWRALPSLTILAGLRYEYFSPYSETNDRLATLDYNAPTFTAVEPVYPNEVGPITGIKYPRSLISPERNNFSPRLGFAWRAFKDTVIRGGYGINYTVGQYGNFIQNLAYQPPFANVQVNEASATTSVCQTENSLANCFPNFTGLPAPGNYAVNAKYRLPYVQVWNLDIQRTFPLGIVLNVGYNGAKGTRLDVLSAPGIYPSVSPIPASGVYFDFEDSVAYSNFNALAVRANKRLQNGISLQMTYTYSHSIDDASSIGAGSSVVAQNWQNIRAEESNSSFDIRNQVTGSFLYELPFGPDKHYLSNGNWASHAFGDWSLSGTYTLADGTPLTPAISASVADVARGTGGSVRPNLIPGTNIRAGGGSLDRWFNTDAFSTNFATGQYYGTASRYSIPGPGTTVVNMSLSKTFQFKDTKSFEVRATANNAFNIVQYAGVNTQFDSTAVGQVTSARTMRQFTFLARYRF